MKPLGIIPARGGSKGVPRKNIRLVAGRPLIAYTIEAARRSKRLSHFIVSTEDREIGQIAQSWGAEVHWRPAHLAEDTSPAPPVVQHILSDLDPDDSRFDSIVYLQPTSPLRTADDIDGAVQLLETPGVESVVSVYRVDDHHPARMYRLNDGWLVPYDREPPGRLRQQLPEVYHRNGAIYACRRQVLEQQGTLVGVASRPFLMPRSRSVNIDDEFDLEIADILLARQVQRGAA